MRTRVVCCSVLAFLQIIIWVSATTRLLHSDDGAYNHHALPPPDIELNVAAYKEMKKIGSRPPNCESKCYGCSPCVAIQVPTINGNGNGNGNGGHLSLQYANYLPEGWKCKCGPSFYSP